jgi:Circadian oscillating protein COP23
MSISGWLLGLASAGGVALTVNILSNNNSNNTTINTNAVSQQTNQTTNVPESISYAYCIKDDLGDYSVARKIGAREKRLISIVSGQEFWGEKFSKEERCQQIASNYTASKQIGATGWGGAMKNGYPIICAATHQGCIVDKSNQIFQLATFKKGVDPIPLIATLKKQADPSYEGADASSIKTVSTFKFFPD